MSLHPKPTSSERQQTDESLRVEREITDHALGDEQVGVDELADAVITRARLRADEVLARARATIDSATGGLARDARAPRRVEHERAVEDRVLREERADADEVLRDERAEHIALLTSEREDTDKDLLSERTRSDDALATRDEFLGIVSHDLRNMLNSITLSAGLIEESATLGHSTDGVVKQAQRIQRGSARMSRLIGDLIDVASIEAGALAVTREVTDIADVVTEAMETFQAQAASQGISLLAELVPPLSAIAFDPARILQVLINLLSNAVKFTPSGGNITLRAEPNQTDVYLSVTDTGVGIPGDKLEAIFQRFLQVNSDRRGLGLGLYISKCIVLGHGGRIWAESKLGAGSKFCFTLPLA
ncbi:MAG TPA: HAMP domain-containing sensor histidine kinase, partial [Polyangiales bacterium]|nr:HAMP domain-containing sensor histidine kinase [Polyangiales bacterium]